MEHSLTTAPYQAIVLAGGAGSRLGGVDKAAVDLDGTPLIGRAFTATANASARVLVGATVASVPADVRVTVEEPAGSGPAAAVVAGLATFDAAQDAEWTLLLACDLPGACEGVRRLDRGLSKATRDGAVFDGVVLADPDGRASWVCGLYRTSKLREAARTLGDAANRPLKALLGELNLIKVAPRADEWRDVDTWEDHAHWVELLHKPAGGVMPEKTIERAAWDAWIAKASEALGIDASLVDVTLVHELSKNVAHNVIRPLAPVSTYMLGIAIGLKLAEGATMDAEARAALAALIPQSPEDAPQTEQDASA